MSRSSDALITLFTLTAWMGGATIVMEASWKSVTIDVTAVNAVTHATFIAPTDAFCSYLAKGTYNSTLYCYKQGTCVVALAAVDIIFKRGRSAGSWICKTSDRDPFMRRGTDGLYYTFNATTRLNYGAAVNACAALSPSGAYRLAQAKTSFILNNIRDFYLDLPDYMGLFYIGLRLQLNGTLNWEDGSVLDPSILKAGEPKLNDGGHHFIIYNRVVDDIMDTNTATFLCQANFDNVTW